MTDSAANPSRIVNPGPGDMEGDWRTYIGNTDADAQWLVTTEVNFDQADYLDDLALSFQHRESNTESGDGYRIGLLIDGDWYVQDSLIAANTIMTAEYLSLSSLDFIEWTGAPADDATAWTEPTIGGGATLPSGTIEGLGLMLIQNANGEAFRFDNIQLSGTAAVPEPSTFAMAAFGLLGLGWFERRRRK